VNQQPHKTVGTGTTTAHLWLERVVVDPAVRALRPDYTAALVVAEGLKPGPSDQASDVILTEAEATARRRLAGRAPHEVRHVAEWRDAYRAFGAKPQRTRPSVEALLRRVESGLPRIDRLTDIYNAVSIAHLMPVGGEDLDAYRGAARLVRAGGSETFDTTSDGAAALEHPEAGEVVWADDEGVTCRRWNWRQCSRTRITDETTRAVFILDALSAAGPAGGQLAADDLVAQLSRLNPGAQFARKLFGHLPAPQPGGSP